MAEPYSKGQLIAVAIKAAAANGIDPQLFVKQIRQESGFDPYARSGAGAEGIAQIVPRYHRGVNTWDPVASLNYAAKWMGELVHKYGGYAPALSVYNSGSPDAYKDPAFAKGQTYRYVKSILGGQSGASVTPTPASSPETAPQDAPAVPPSPVSSLIPDTVAMNLTSGLSPRQQLSSLVTAVASQPRVTPQPVPAAATPPSGGAGTAPTKFVSPVTGAKFGRVDQGVDYSSSSPYLSPGSGVVTRIAPNSVKGGSNIGLYVKLDTPITVNGRTYNGIYVWHTNPLVKQGQRVTAGTPLMSGGAAEVGFSDGYKPVAPLVGGFGAGTKASQAGHDFLDFVNSLTGRK